MPAYDTPALRLPASAPRLIPINCCRVNGLGAWFVAMSLLSTRMRVLQAENDSLARAVRELTNVRDNLLDAAGIHALCEHEERLMGLVRYYDRPRPTA